MAKVKKTDENVKNPQPALEIGSHIKDAPQPPLPASARPSLRLAGVGCRPWFGVGFGTDSGTASCCWPGAAKNADADPNAAIVLRSVFLKRADCSVAAQSGPAQ